MNHIKKVNAGNLAIVVLICGIALFSILTHVTDIKLMKVHYQARIEMRAK